MGHSIERASGHSTSVPFCKGTQVDRFTNVLLFKEEERGGGFVYANQSDPSMLAQSTHTHLYIRMSQSRCLPWHGHPLAIFWRVARWIRLSSSGRLKAPAVSVTPLRMLTTAV